MDTLLGWSKYLHKCTKHNHVSMVAPSLSVSVPSEQAKSGWIQGDSLIHTHSLPIVIHLA